MEDGIPSWLPFLFPVAFVALWLAVSTTLGLTSGWFGLQQWYQEPSGKPLLRLRRQSGSMGPGVGLNGILKLSAYPTGLGVGISRLFGPFQKPFLVPWKDIKVEPSKSFLTPTVRLRFGDPPAGTLKISAAAWSRLVAAAGPKAAAAFPNALPPSRGSVARGMFLEWVIITTLCAAFFYFASRSSPMKAAVPLAVCIGFPGVAFGLGQLVRFFRER